jgi:DNA-binding FadR family transcriptional regulator
MPADTLDRFDAPSSVNRRRVHGSVAHELAVLIVSGRLAPGEVLPNEDQLSERLAVSRTAYREAVKILGAKGLVETRPKTGTRVNPRALWNLLDPDILAWHFQVEPSPVFIRSLFELRRIVEPAAAALAARRRTESDIDQIRGALIEMRSAEPGSVAGLEADLRFHDAVIRATANEPLFALSTVVESTLRWSVRLTLDANPRAHRDAWPKHDAVFQAIVASDERRAHDRTADLIDSALQDTLASLERLHPPT